jgi:hypothetical protein
MFGMHGRANCTMAMVFTIGKRPIERIEAPELPEAIRKIGNRGAYNLAHLVLQACGQVVLQYSGRALYKSWVTENRGTIGDRIRHRANGGYNDLRS